MQPNVWLFQNIKNLCFGMGDDFNGIDVEKKNQQKSFQLLFDVMEFFSSPEINYSNHSIKISANFSFFASEWSRTTSVLDFADNLSKCDSQKKKSEKLVEMYVVFVKNCNE